MRRRTANVRKSVRGDGVPGTRGFSWGTRHTECLVPPVGFSGGRAWRLRGHAVPRALSRRMSVRTLAVLLFSGSRGGVLWVEGFRDWFEAMDDGPSRPRRCYWVVLPWDTLGHSKEKMQI